MTVLPIVIRLAGEPKGKGRPRFSRQTGRAYTPATTRHFESDLRYAAQEIMGDRPLVEGPLFVTVTAAVPIAPSWSQKKQHAALAGEIWPTGRPDVDNYGKAAADALNKIVFNDDSQIVYLTIIKHYSAKPELRIVVSKALPVDWCAIDAPASPSTAFLPASTDLLGVA